MDKKEKPILRTSRTKYGLIGRNISYSFSASYFKKKFQALGLDHHTYENFDLPEIFELPFILYQQKELFGGLNVTIPYKEAVWKYLDTIDDEAAAVGAVNTIKVEEDDTLTGYNTDVFGFVNSLKPLLKKQHSAALILGTGGASKAVAYGLKKLGISSTFVSRSVEKGDILYSQLNKEHLSEHKLIVNCSPVGTYPKVEEAPDIPYEYLSSDHIVYDLIYNPEVTAFLKKGAAQGATIKNGLEMLELQAEKSWELWNS